MIWKFVDKIKELFSHELNSENMGLPFSYSVALKPLCKTYPAENGFVASSLVIFFLMLEGLPLNFFFLNHFKEIKHQNALYLNT